MLNGYESVNKEFYFSSSSCYRFNVCLYIRKEERGYGLVSRFDSIRNSFW